MDIALIQRLVQPARTTILLLLMDGLGGLPLTPKALTALEAAHTPHLDDLAARPICGLHQPVGDGITAAAVLHIRPCSATIQSNTRWGGRSSRHWGSASS